jgi:hypothetical protein
MTLFSCPTRNAQDIKVILVGLVCAMGIFSVVTTYEVYYMIQPIHIDLVQGR